MKAGKTGSVSTGTTHDKTPLADKSTNTKQKQQSTVDSMAKDSEKLLRPFTPPNQTGSKLHDEDGNSPVSQACTSGSVTPNSEGVRRADRQKYHAPPAGPFA